ncbi:MAG: FliH/SctL family protein [Planctomycetota bacterium]
MGVVKPSVSRKHVQDAIVLDLGDLRDRAERLCADARETAARTVRDAQDERERLIATAREEGREAGHAAGLAEGREKGRAEGHAEALEQRSAELGALRERYERAIGAYEERREEMLSEARAQVLELACAFAERVTLRAVELDGSIVERQLERVLSMAIEPSRVVLRVHPDDAERVGEALPKLLDRFSSSPHARVEEDGGLERGSCVLRTDRGEIDASVRTMLDEIVGALLPGGGS